MPFDPNQPAYGTKEFYSYIGRKGGLATAAKRAAERAARFAAEARFLVGASIQSIVAKMADLARQNVYGDDSVPNDIADAISIGDVNDSGDTAWVDIIVDVGENDIEDRRGRRAARAFEYGSGEHGESGQGYPIKAKNAPNLRFFWTYMTPLGYRGRKEIEEDEWVSPDEVTHPGVEARPYLQPAIDAYRNELNDAAGKSFKNAFVSANFEVVTG
jgi:hypothetical protein